jgi:hypothetical protein
MAIKPKKHHSRHKALDFIPLYYEYLDANLSCEILPTGAHIILVKGQTSPIIAV